MASYIHYLKLDLDDTMCNWK